MNTPSQYPEKRKFLVTAALPYPNGPLHIGHVAGVHLPGDIYYRFLRTTGREAVMLCGTDDHGVWIEIAAKKEGMNEVALTEKYNAKILEALESIAICYDVFSKTHSEVHRILAQDFFRNLQENGYLESRPQHQAFCQDCNQFLPDRYIEGTCSKCGNPRARWDQCESCGSLLNTSDLLNPVCKICEGGNISERETYQYFFRLSAFEEKLRAWLADKPDWKANVMATSVRKWLTEGLEDRSVSRDIRWGIPVPGDESKKLYVWFEAPMGYISFLMEYAKAIGREDMWKEFWDRNSDAEIIHFIGKDNVVFHTIIWPAILMADGRFKLPTNVPGNEFVNLEWSKISTSRNHAVWLHEMTEKFNPDAIRFYLTHCIPETKDSNFSWQEFLEKNNELANTLGNLVNRVLVFSWNKFGGRYGPPDRHLLDERDLDFLSQIDHAKIHVAEALEAFKFRKALGEAMKFVAEWNRYFNDRKPWSILNEDPELARSVINVCIQHLAAVSIILEPFLPFTSERIKSMLWMEGKFQFSDIGSKSVLPESTIRDVVPLFRKLNLSDISQELAKLWLT